MLQYAFGAAASVRFTSMVNCSGNNTCLVDLTNVHGPVTFFGAPGITAGFLRTDTYTYPLLQLNSTSNVTIANLTFDEGPDDPACTPYQVNGPDYAYPCRSTISIVSSSNILLEQVSVLHSKNHGIESSGTRASQFKTVRYRMLASLESGVASISHRYRQTSP